MIFQKTIKINTINPRKKIILKIAVLEINLAFTWNASETKERTKTLP